MTKPGGRVLLIAYGNPAEFEALHVFVSAAQAVVPEFEGPPEDEPPLEFQIADPEVLRQRLTNAGLRDVTVDTSHRESISVHTGQQLWDWTIGSNPIPGELVADHDKGPAMFGGPFAEGCSAVSYSPASCRVQYHRRWQA